MMNNVVYFSGLHCSGKSTLIENLSSDKNVLKHEKEYNLDLENTLVRVIWRMAKYYIEAVEQREMSKNNPKKIILADRCAYDNFAYIKGFKRLGWVSEKNVDEHRQIYEALFDNELRPKNIIFVSPPLEWIKERLKGRWEKKKPKWRENNMEYLEAVYHEFNKLYENTEGNILKLTECDMADRIRKSRDFINSIKIIR